MPNKAAIFLLFSHWFKLRNSKQVLKYHLNLGLTTECRLKSSSWHKMARMERHSYSRSTHGLVVAVAVSIDLWCCRPSRMFKIILWPNSEKLTLYFLYELILWKIVKKSLEFFKKRFWKLISLIISLEWNFWLHSDKEG